MYLQHATNPNKKKRGGWQAGGARAAKGGRAAGGARAASCAATLTRRRREASPWGHAVTRVSSSSDAAPAHAPAVPPATGKLKRFE